MGSVEDRGGMTQWYNWWGNGLMIMVTNESRENIMQLNSHFISLDCRLYNTTVLLSLNTHVTRPTQRKLDGLSITK